MPTQVLETEAIRNTPLCKLYEVSKGLSTGGGGDATLCGLYGRELLLNRLPLRHSTRKAVPFEILVTEKIYIPDCKINLASFRC